VRTIVWEPGEYLLLFVLGLTAEAVDLLQLCNAILLGALLLKTGALRGRAFLVGVRK
jgi:hypothetical protein